MIHWRKSTSIFGRRRGTASLEIYETFFASFDGNRFHDGLLIEKRHASVKTEATLKSVEAVPQCWVDG